MDAAIKSRNPLVHLEGTLVNRMGVRFQMAVSISPVIEADQEKGAVVLLEDFTRLDVVKKSHVKAMLALEEEVERYSKEGGETFDQEYRILTRDGEIIWVYDFTRIVRNREGTITHYDGYLFDNARRKELEASLLKKQRSL